MVTFFYLNKQNDSNAHNSFCVDDDRDDLEFFEETISMLDREVSLFTIGDELLFAMQNPPPSPSVVFLDLNMPAKSGHEVLHEIRGNANFNHVPLIVLSTASDLTTIEQCRKAGADLYVTKFTSISGFSAALKKILNIDWNVRERTLENFLFKK